MDSISVEARTKQISLIWQKGPVQVCQFWDKFHYFLWLWFDLEKFKDFKTFLFMFSFPSSDSKLDRQFCLAAPCRFCQFAPGRKRRWSKSYVFWGRSDLDRFSASLSRASGLEKLVRSGQPVFITCGDDPHFCNVLPKVAGWPASVPLQYWANFLANILQLGNCSGTQLAIAILPILVAFEEKWTCFQRVSVWKLGSWIYGSVHKTTEDEYFTDLFCIQRDCGTQLHVSLFPGHGYFRTKHDFMFFWAPDF